MTETKTREVNNYGFEKIMYDSYGDKSATKEHLRRRGDDLYVCL